MKSKIIFCIEGMNCQACATRIEKTLNNKNFIYEANVNFANEEAKVVFNSKKTNTQDIINIIKKLGFNASIKTSPYEYHKIKFPLKLLLIWIIAILFIINMIGSIFSFTKLTLPIYIQFILATIVQFLLGRNFYKGAYTSIKNKIANMDVLVVLGTTSIWIYSTIIFFYSIFLKNNHEYVYFETSVMIMAVISTGKYIENFTKKTSLNSIKLIMQLTPKKIQVLKNNKWIDTDYTNIVVNDILKSSQGQRICADGKILNGTAWIDESHLTGESKSIYKKSEDLVLAGSLIKEGSIIYQANKIGEKTFLGDIIQSLNESLVSKANISKITDKVSTIFVPIVVLIAIVTFIITYFITKNLQLSIKHLSSVLIVACPCALGLATPASIMVGLGLATKNGLLFKDAQSMEITAKLNTIVFDKTGTLTEGAPKIIDYWINNNNLYNKKDLLKYAASVELNSNHPLAKTIVNEAQNNNIKLFQTKNVQNFIGKGIKAQTIKGEIITIGTLDFCNFQLPKDLEQKHAFNTIICIKLNNDIIGTISLSDTLKPNTEIAIQKLNKLGINLYVISGDKKSVTNHIAQQLNIPNSNVFANMSPKNKLQEIEKLISQNKYVAMVGDGINDCPALAKSTIGFAMQNGTDIANNTANIVLMNNSISQVYDALLISKAILRNIQQNLFFAFIYNIFSIPLAAIGLLNPIIASLSMALSSITVLFNSLRLKNFKID